MGTTNRSRGRPNTGTAVRKTAGLVNAVWNCGAGVSTSGKMPKSGLTAFFAATGVFGEITSSGSLTRRTKRRIAVPGLRHGEHQQFQRIFATQKTDSRSVVCSVWVKE